MITLGDTIWEPFSYNMMKTRTIFFGDAAGDVIEDMGQIKDQ